MNSLDEPVVEIDLMACPKGFRKRILREIHDGRLPNDWSSLRTILVSLTMYREFVRFGLCRELNHEGEQAMNRIDDFSTSSEPVELRNDGRISSLLRGDMELAKAVPFDVRLDERSKALSEEVTKVILSCRQDLETLEKAAEELMQTHQHHISLIKEANHDVTSRLLKATEILIQLRMDIDKPAQAPMEFEPDVQR